MECWSVGVMRPAAAGLGMVKGRRAFLDPDPGLNPGLTPDCPFGAVGHRDLRRYADPPTRRHA